MAEPPLGRSDDGATPPLHLHAHPSPWLVTLLLAVTVVAGAAAVALLLTGRWRPRARALTRAGMAVAAALALLPPLGSADHLSYAAYGRMVVTGHDAYRTTPAALAAHDPVAAAVEPPWQHEPSVYGPLATAEQALAAEVGGRDVAAIVLGLDLLGAAAFLAVGWLLLRSAAGEAVARRRAALWAANPLLWLQLVAGAHLDVLVAALAVAAVAIGKRRPAPGAAVAGLAGIVKPPGGLVWLALAWPVRRQPRALALLVAAAAVVVAPAYALAGPDAVRQLGRAGRRISRATPWRPLLDGAHLPRALVLGLALLVAAALVVVLMRGQNTNDPAPLAVALTTAYVVAAAYALPWYDALPWALLGLVAASWRDWLMLAHTTVLSLAYLPGRDVALPRALADLTRVVRSDVSPAVLAVLVVGAAVVSLRSASRSAGSGGRPLPP